MCNFWAKNGYVRDLLAENVVWILDRGILGSVENCEFKVGFCCLCKCFRKSEVVLEASISEIRINVGIDCGFGD